MKKHKKAIEILIRFPATELLCVEYAERIRWGEKVQCAYCGGTNLFKRSKDMRHRCKDCGKSTSVTINTVLHDTRLPLKTWFKALTIITHGKLRVSAHQLSRYIGVSYPSAYRMYHKVRELMGQEVKYSEEFLKMGRFYTMMCTILHQYNYVNPKQLINYTGEYEYKYNNRGQNDKMFNEILKKLFTTCK
jgi:transposase-like protein